MSEYTNIDFSSDNLEKVFEGMSKEINRTASKCKSLINAPPTFVFEPIGHFDEVDFENQKYPQQFHWACNFLSIPRYIEIFNYINLKAMIEYLEDSFNLLNNNYVNEKSIYSFCIYIRSFLEQFAYYSSSIDEIIEICQPIKQLEILEGSNFKVTKENIGDFITIFGKAAISLDAIIKPSTIDVSKLVSNEDISEDISIDKEEARKPNNIIGKLKKLEKKVPALHPLYSACSELIHPNSFPFISQANFVGEFSDKGYLLLGYDFKKQKSSGLIEIPALFIGDRLIKCLKDIEIYLVEREKLIGKTQRAMLLKSRKLARSWMTNTLPYSPIFKGAKDCPCGSRKSFLKCCGKYMTKSK